MIENWLIDSSQKIVNEINLMQSKIETTSEDDILMCTFSCPKENVHINTQSDILLCSQHVLVAPSSQM